MLKQADGPNRPYSCSRARSNAVKLGDTMRDCAQVKFDIADPSFKLGQLLALELHRFEEEVRGCCRLCSQLAVVQAQSCRRPY